MLLAFYLGVGLGLTEQVFSEVYLACQEHRRPETIRHKRHAFVHVPERRFFGFEEIAVLGQAVQMAAAERAVLDAIDRPRFAGGIREASRIVSRADAKVSWDELIGLARKWGATASASWTTSNRRSHAASWTSPTPTKWTTP